MSDRKVPSLSEREYRDWPDQWWSSWPPGARIQQQLKDYQEALKLGEVLVTYARVMMIGPGGVGKSSLLRGLMNQKLLKDGDSTMLADTRTVKRQFWAKAGDFADSYWADVTDLDEIQELAGLLQLVDQAQSGHSSLCHAAVKFYPPGFISRSIEPISDQYVSSIKDSVVQNLLKRVVEHANSRLENPAVLESEVLIHVWDCGGQTVFLDVLPAFLTSRTMFLLFFDARQDLLGKCNTSSYKEGKVLSKSEHSFTVLHLLSQWMASIHAMCMKENAVAYTNPNVLNKTSENESPITHRKKATFDDDKGAQNSATVHPSLQMRARHPPEHDAVNTIPKFPRIIPVGTHGDDPNVLGKRAEVLDTLRSHCEDKAYTHLLLDGVIVDNTTAGCGEQVEDKGFKYIREKVHQLASKQLAIQTPVAWVLFRKALKNVAQDRPIVSYQQAVAVGKACAIAEDVVPSVLHFYHELGVFLHYTEIESLSWDVIADPQWLVKQLGKLLAPEGFKQKISNQLLWKPLQEKGILIQSLYEAVWEGSNLPPQSLADLLEHFQLAALISIKPPATVSSHEGRKYFIPCALQFCSCTAECTTKSQEYVKMSSPLHLRFSTQYVPPGFFTRLATALTKESKCELLFKRGIYRDKMTFAYGEVDKIDEFTILEHTSSVQVTVVRTDYRQLHIPTFGSVCCDIMKLIQACSATIRQWLPLVNVEVTFFCEQCREKECPVKNHFISIPSGSTTNSVLRCQAAQNCRPTKGQQYWLKIPNTPEYLTRKGDLSVTELQGVAGDIQKSGKLKELADALEVVPLLESLAGDTNASLTLLQRWHFGVESSLLAHSHLVYHLKGIGLVNTSDRLCYREFLSHTETITAAYPSSHHSRCDHKAESLSHMHITPCSRYIDGDVTLLAAALDIPDKDMSAIRSEYKNVQAQALQMLRKWCSSGRHTRHELIEILQSTEFQKAAHILMTSSENTSTAGASEPQLQDLVTQVCTTKWYHLGLQLDIDDYSLQQIQADERGSQEQKTCMFRTWLRVCENPSWKAVVKALKAIGENNLAAKLGQQYCGDPIVS